jgi:hypothetical protein
MLSALRSAPGSFAALERRIASGRGCRFSLRALLAVAVSGMLVSAPGEATAATFRGSAAPLVAMVFFAGLLLVREWPAALLESAWVAGTLFAICLWLVGTRYRPVWLWLAGKSLARRTAFARFNPATPSVAQDNDEPERISLDREALLRTARQCFLDLQAAWDQGVVEGLRRRTTPHMLNDLLQELAMRGDGPNRTDVVTLEATLISLENWDGGYVASVQFSGMIRESAEHGAAPFKEVWMLTRREDDATDWRLARQQALL